MMPQWCGYGGHVCSERAVQFISRGFNINDYCVGGKRVQVADDGTTRNATADDLKRILLFELDQYADYIRWHVEKVSHAGWSGVQLRPFDAAVAQAEVSA